MTITRDPRIDPQPGDELRDNGIIRRVMRRDGDRMLIKSVTRLYWMRLDSWQKWCRENPAMAQWTKV